MRTEEEVKSHKQLLREYSGQKQDYETKFNVTLVVLMVLIGIKILLQFM